MDLTNLNEFAKRYAEAWCSQDPDSVAAFYAEDGSLSVNDGPPAVRRQAIAEEARGFMKAFPDMEVTMDDLVGAPDGTVFHDANGNEHRTGRFRNARSNKWIRGVAV